MAQDTKMSKSQQQPSSYSLGGLTSLNKESQERLEAYGHLFYQLQVGDKKISSPALKQYSVNLRHNV